MSEATENILQVQLPGLKERMEAGSLTVNNIDVFCERGVFDLSSTRSILKAGKDMGLNINFHGDELHPMNSAQVHETVEQRCQGTLQGLSLCTTKLNKPHIEQLLIVASQLNTYTATYRYI